MDEASLQVAKNTNAVPCAILADLQTKGRGRRENKWCSREGNFFTTLVIWVDQPMSMIAQLSFVMAITLKDMLQSFSPTLEIAYKWPNDILLGYKKIGGILLEVDYAGNHPYLKIGVGVNLRHGPNIETNYATTSIFEAENLLMTNTACLEKLLEIFTEHFNMWRKNGFQPIRNAWLKDAAFLGTPIKVNLPHAQREGIFDGIDTSGALCLVCAGKVEKISTGDVYA